MLIFRLLASYLTLGVDPPDPPEDPDNKDAGDGDPDGELGDLETLGDEDPEDPDRRGADDDVDNDDPEVLRQQVATERARADKAEREHREAAERAAAAERARQQQPTRSQEQELFEREQARLADPKCSENERWQIQSNRTLRESARASAESLRTTQDLSDRAAFTQLCTDKPLAKKYAKRVEDRLDEIRKGGGNMPRALIFKFLVGDDIVEGKVKTARKPASQGSGSQQQGTQQQRGGSQAGGGVSRGKPPAQRGDVRSRQQASEREKRNQRLDGAQI